MDTPNNRGTRHSVLITSHRYSRVRDTVPLVVLEDGHVIESGIPGELLARYSWFAGFSQARSPDEGEESPPSAQEEEETDEVEEYVQGNNLAVFLLIEADIRPIRNPIHYETPDPVPEKSVDQP